MTANDSTTYLSYLNKIVVHYIDTYHQTINKNPVNADYSALPEKMNY